MKKTILYITLLIILVTILTSCSYMYTQVSYADFSIEYDVNTKMCTVTNIDDRDLYGIHLDLDVINSKGSSKEITQKIANLIVGESFSFKIIEEDVKDVVIESVSANTNPNWEELEEREGMNFLYWFLGICGAIILIVILIAIFSYFFG